MPIIAKCEACGKRFQFNDQDAGKTSKCGACGKPLPIVAEKSQAIAPVSYQQPAVVRAVAPPSQIATTKPCPFCGEQIQQAAVKCRHCGELLDAQLRAASQPQQQAPAQQPMFFAPPVNVSTHVVQQTVFGRRPFNHGLHFLLTVITCGIWLPVWMTLWMIYVLS